MYAVSHLNLDEAHSSSSSSSRVCVLTGRARLVLVPKRCRSRAQFPRNLTLIGSGRQRREKFLRRCQHRFYASSCCCCTNSRTGRTGEQTFEGKGDSSLFSHSFTREGSIHLRDAAASEVPREFPEEITAFTIGGVSTHSSKQ